MTDTGDTSKDLTRATEEIEAVEEAAGLSPRLVFETIRRNGEEELNRPMKALWFSGITAGLLISFSVLGEAILRAHLPDKPWRFIVENAGYSLGFLLVILGRVQLFTENTITTVVPVTLEPTWHAFRRTCRLWGAVLAANVVGAFLIATFFAYGHVLSDGVMTAMIELSHHATGMPALDGLLKGIPAGILIAAIVWMLPSAQGTEVAVIFLFTWLIALGDFTHIVAGSVEMAFLIVLGELGFYQAVFGFFLPVLVGNVVGGTVVFTMLTWAQVKPEVAGSR